MSDPLADLIRREAAPAPAWLASHAPDTCIVCKQNRVFIGVYVTEQGHGRNLVYGLCNTCVDLPLEEIERWIRQAVRRGGEEHLLPPGFGR